MQTRPACLGYQKPIHHRREKAARVIQPLFQRRVAQFGHILHARPRRSLSQRHPARPTHQRQMQQRGRVWHTSPAAQSLALQRQPIQIKITRQTPQNLAEMIRHDRC